MTVFQKERNNAHLGANKLCTILKIELYFVQIQYNFIQFTSMAAGHASQSISPRRFSYVQNIIRCVCVSERGARGLA